MQAYATFDESHLPVVTITFTGESATEENFRRYLEQTRQLYARKEPLALIFDATHAGFPGLRFQKMQADWLAENESLMKDYCRGAAYVISSALIRTVLKGIFALQAQPVPYIVVGSVEEAGQWAEERVGS